MSPTVYGSSPAPFMVCVYFEVSVNSDCQPRPSLSIKYLPGRTQYFTVDKTSARARPTTLSRAPVNSPVVAGDLVRRPDRTVTMTLSEGSGVE